MLTSSLCFLCMCWSGHYCYVHRVCQSLEKVMFSINNQQCRPTHCNCGRGTPTFLQTAVSRKGIENKLPVCKVFSLIFQNFIVLCCHMSEIMTYFDIIWNFPFLWRSVPRDNLSITELVHDWSACGQLMSMCILIFPGKSLTNGWQGLIK
jgi:hypothetical protein